MIFHTKITLSFVPEAGNYRNVLHFTSEDGSERFELPFGSGAFNHFYCELLKVGMSETDWNDAVTAVLAEDGTFRRLPSLDLDNEDVKCLRQYHSATRAEIF